MVAVVIKLLKTSEIYIGIPNISDGFFQINKIRSKYTKSTNYSNSKIFSVSRKVIILKENSIQ